VTFAIDSNGIVNVSAKDLGTGKQQEITIEASSNMSRGHPTRYAGRPAVCCGGFALPGAGGRPQPIGTASLQRPSDPVRRKKYTKEQRNSLNEPINHI